MRGGIGKAPVRWGVEALACIFLLSFPFWASRYWVDVGFYVGIYSLLGLGLNIILGAVGLFNLGHAAF